jgi:hypothetical protein
VNEFRKSTIAASSMRTDPRSERRRSRVDDDRGRCTSFGEPRDRELSRRTGIYPAEVWFYEAAPQKDSPRPSILLFSSRASVGNIVSTTEIHGPEKLFPALAFGRTR